MNESIDKKDVFLQPGEFFFGDKGTRVSTLLGSCVAITLWHPQKLIGGMCHYMLPSPQNRKSPQLNGKYAEDAIKMFLYEIRQAGTLPNEYQAKIFGGGHMFSTIIDDPVCTSSESKCFESLSCKKISCKNALIAPYLLTANGFKIVNSDLGGKQHRKVIFEIDSGDVWIRKGN